MATKQFYVIAFKNRAFETLFAKKKLDMYVAPIVKPFEASVLAFSEQITDQVLEVIGLTRDDISGYEDTERPNVKLLRFSKKYEFSIEAWDQTSEQIVPLIEEPLIDILREDVSLNISVSYSNLASTPAYGPFVSDEMGDRLTLDFPAAFNASTGTMQYVSGSEGAQYLDLSQSLVFDYIVPGAIIRTPDRERRPVAVLRNGRIIMLVNIVGTYNAFRQNQAAAQEGAAGIKAFLRMAVPVVVQYMREHPGIISTVSTYEKRYKFYEFLNALVKKRSEGYLTRLAEVRRQIPAAMTQLSSLIEEEKHLDTVVGSVDPESAKKKLVDDITSITNSPDVKEVMFEEDGILVKMKHIMVPSTDNKGEIIHCGEIDLVIPFDNKKELVALRNDSADYPEDIKDLVKIDVPHPNVFSRGNFCFGNTAESFAVLRGQWEISAVFTLANNFLHTYNPKSPTRDPKLFPHTSKERAKEIYLSMYPQEKKATVSTFSGQSVTEDTENDEEEFDGFEEEFDGFDDENE